VITINTIGRVHSLESFGAVDGPGIRFVVFMQGCNLRCLYCHNPDTWKISDGTEYTAKQLADVILQYKSYIKNGGVTFSGGEPLLQSQFICEVSEILKSDGLHIAVDTSGAVDLQYSKQALKKADLVLLDIKDIDDDDCIKLTGQSNKNAINTLEFLECENKEVWIRHVILPQYTFNIKKLEKLAVFLKDFKCLKKVELLPFHKIGEYKWDKLGYEYKLKNINAADNFELEQAAEVLRKFQLNVSI